jgi:hypothetical protein
MRPGVSGCTVKVGGTNEGESMDDGEWMRRCPRE